ncbi:MAG: EamA family transporter [Desulfobacula sp.]|nr:EamA family transporter [Desulfobacula sp.]
MMERPETKPTKMWLAYSGLSLAVFFWAVNTVIAKAVVLEIRPMALSFYRWLIAFMIILPFAASHLKKDSLLIRQHLGFLFVLALPSVAAYNSILYFGAQFTTAVNISLVAAAMPVMTLLFSWIMNKEKPLCLQSIGIVVSIIGMLLIITKGSFRLLLNLSFNPGDLLIVFAIASWAFYSVLLKKRQINISPISFLTVLIALGTLCILPFYTWEFVVYKGFELNRVNITIFLYLGIFPSVLSYIFWNYGVRTAGASVASVFMYLLPVFTSAIAFVFLDEKLYSHHFMGGFLILLGLILSSFRGA